jgi:hypothetical protein
MMLEECVIQLHDIARQIEQEIGRGALSDDIRSDADRLHQLIKKQDFKTFDSDLNNV